MNSCSSLKYYPKSHIYENLNYQKIKHYFTLNEEEYDKYYKEGQWSADYDWNKDKLNRLPDSMDICDKNFYCKKAFEDQLRGYQNGYQTMWNKLSAR